MGIKRISLGALLATLSLARISHAGQCNNPPSEAGCWFSYSGPSYLTFDVSEGFGCAVFAPAGTPTEIVQCYNATTVNQMLTVNWASTTSNGLIPAPVKGVALGHPDYGSPYGPYNTYTILALLDANSNVWFTDGDASAPLFSQGSNGQACTFNAQCLSGQCQAGTCRYFNFGTIYNFAPAVDNNNNSLCLSKIVFANGPTGAAGPVTDLIGLSCSNSPNPGAIYVLGWTGTQWAWFLGTTPGHEPWSMLSSLMQFTDISHGNAQHVGTGQGAYLLETSGSVVLVGAGSAPNGQVSYSPPTRGRPAFC
jgi:hypothetical protein